MSAMLSLPGVSANIPQRFYDSSGCRCCSSNGNVSCVDGAGGGGSSNQPSCYWHGRRAYDHVQAWVNSLPQPSAPQHAAQPVSQQQQQQQQHLVQPLQWPDVLPHTVAAASSTSRPPLAAAAAECTAQSSARQPPSVLDYAPAGPVGGEKNQTSRLPLACIPNNNKDRSERHDGSQALQFMKANHCSFSSDASVPSSVEDILNERKGNPEELLRCLGFGSHKSSMAARLPARFLTNPSHAKGIEADAIIARHPELLTLKEPLTDALSVELLHKLPSYYQRELVTSGDDAETFSSLHRRFSERLSTAAAGEAAAQQQQQQQQQRRRESLSLQRSAVSGRLGRYGPPPANATAGDRLHGGGTRDYSGDETLRQDFMQPSELAEGGSCRPTVAAVRPSGLTRAVANAANRQNSIAASLSSLSDSVFMSNSDGAEVDCRYFDDDDDDLEGAFDPSRWIDPVSHDGLGNSPVGRSAAEQQRVGSVVDDRLAVADLGSSHNGARRDCVAGRQVPAAVSEKHRSLDLQDLAAAAAAAALPASAATAAVARTAVGGSGSAVAGMRSKFATPVTVLVTSYDGCSTTDAPDSSGDGVQPPSGLLLRVKPEGRSPSTGSGSRTPMSSSSPMFLTVGVDSFESCESDTQTITGDMPDDLGGSVAGGGGISRCASAVDDDVAAAAAVFAAPPAAAGERGATSGNRLLLAVAPAMESFEMEEVQSIGDTTRRGTSTMNRSHSAQSDSSGFADVEDEQQRQQSPPSAAATTATNEAGDRDCSGGAELRTAVRIPRAFKMVDVVDAVLNMSAQKNRLAHSVAPDVESQFADAPMSGDPLPTSTGQRLDLSSAAHVAVTTSMPPPSLDSLSEGAPTEDEYSSALDVQERRSSLGLQSECSDELPSFDRMPTRAIGAELLLPRSRMEPQALSTSLPWDRQDAISLVGSDSRGSDDGELSAVAHELQPATAAAIRRAPSAFSSTNEDVLPWTAGATPQRRTVAKPAWAAANATSRRLTLHGAPLMRQCAIDLNVVHPLPSPCVLRQSNVVGSLVQADEAAAVVEEKCSPSLEPPAQPNWCCVSAVAGEEEEETVVVSSAQSTACGVAASPAAAVDCHRCPSEPQHLAPGCPRVALSSSPGSELSPGRLHSVTAAAADTSSAVLMALLKPASLVTARTASDPDVRLVQRAIQRYRATAYETEALLDVLAQSLPDDVRRELAEELESLDDVRQSVAHEAVLLEATIVERLLGATRAASAPPPRSGSSPPPQSGSPPLLLPPAAVHSLHFLSSPLTSLPVLQQQLRRQSAAGSVCSSKTSQSSVVEQCTKLLKEQIYQQKLLESRGGGGSAAMSAVSSAHAGIARRPDYVADLQQQVTLLETKQKYEQRIAELEVTTLKLMLQAKEEEIKRLKLLADID